MRRQLNLTVDITKIRIKASGVVMVLLDISLNIGFRRAK
jgi:hypothetical protein